MRRLVQSMIAIAVLTATAFAQPAPPPAPAETPASRWSVSAGYEVFALRDISRNTRPPDASPVSWRGSGPSVSGRYDMVRARSARHSAQSESEAYSGGNWLSNTVVRADWRVAGTTRLVAAWRRAYDGYASDHYSYAGHRHTIELGVSYAR